MESYSPGNPYQLASRILEASAVRTGYTQLMATQPVTLQPDTWTSMAGHGEVMTRYFESCLDVFRTFLKAPETAPSVVSATLGDAPRHLDIEYHASMDDTLLTSPCFYRTDESKPGHVLEVQCPGSLWGDHVLLASVLRTVGRLRASARRQDLAASFCEAARSLLGSEPVIHHLLDNASAPHTMRYFIDVTESGGSVKYFGNSPAVRAIECNFVRSHSVYGLVAENFFKRRLQKATSGLVAFDLPPHLLFDQKLCLTWPFEPETRDSFDGSVRDLFAFSSVVRSDSLRLPEDEGGEISLSEFARRPRKERGYFLKYAGTDVSMNWGSLAVYSLRVLSQEKCLKLLTMASEDFARGKAWLIQKADEVESPVSWWNLDGTVSSATLSQKFSRFYCRGNLLGALIQYRNFYKVHGQPDTINAIAVEY